MSKLTKVGYLEAVALHHMAREHAKKTEEYQHALLTVLGIAEGSGYIEDSIYELSSLDRALKLAGFELPDQTS